MKILCTALLALVTLPALAKDNKQQGYAALAAGRYADAYSSWLVPADYDGDAEAQEAMALLLFSDKPIRHRLPAPRKALALQFLYRSALNGYPGAVQRMASGSEEGKLGLVKDMDAAACWRRVLAGNTQPMACAGLTRFKNKAGRAQCDQLVMRGGHASLSGAEAAQRCLANKTPAILIPMPPPTTKYMTTLDKAYGRYGIEWMSAGDAFSEQSMHFMESFNTAMAENIQRRHGADVFDKIHAEIQAAMGW